MSAPNFHDPRTMSAEHERELALALLAAVAERGAPCEVMSRGGVMDAIVPPPLNERGRVDGRTRAGKAWYRDCLDAILVACRLVEAGQLADEPKPDGGGPWTVSVTDAGRARLAAYEPEAVTP